MTKTPNKTHRPVTQEETEDEQLDFTGEDEWLNFEDSYHSSDPRHDWKIDCGNHHFKFLSYEQALHNVSDHFRTVIKRQ
jgi:hypothetical protein